MRSSVTVSAIRKKPSPPAPSAPPGMTITPSCSSALVAKARDDSPFWDRHPHVHGCLGLGGSEIDLPQTSDRRVPTPLEGGDVSGHPLFPALERCDARGLDSEKLPRIHERLHLRKRRDDIAVPDHPPQPPPRHVVRLGQGVKFDRDVASPVELEDAPDRYASKAISEYALSCMSTASRSAQNRIDCSK